MLRVKIIDRYGVCVLAYSSSVTDSDHALALGIRLFFRWP